MKKVTVIGGGLAGLLTAIQLNRAKIEVQLFEKKGYPFHRVCGEYISNEVVPFLKSLKLFPEVLHPSFINSFQLTAINGKSVILPLDRGGFGISRYAFDHWLFQIAQQEGVEVFQNSEVNSVSYHDDQFEFSTLQGKFSTDVIIGSFGKRSRLDKTMKRSFIKKRSPYIGVKYHLRTHHPANLIALHNFKDGYCGISNVENGITNLCYLSHSDNLKKTGNIKAMEEQVLYKNPLLKNIFLHAEFLFAAPETINEISFETKEPVSNHVLMCGDAAGMITPLCGNGMAMAIHSSKLLSELVVEFCNNPSFTRSALEKRYEAAWSQQFATRLWIGRQLQHLFGSNFASNLAVGLAQRTRPTARYLISKTHGTPI